MQTPNPLLPARSFCSLPVNSLKQTTQPAPPVAWTWGAPLGGEGAGTALVPSRWPWGHPGGFVALGCGSLVGPLEALHLFGCRSLRASLPPQERCLMEGPLLAPAQPYGFSLQGVKREKKDIFHSFYLSLNSGIWLFP